MRSADLAAVIAIAAIVPTAPHWPPPEYNRMLGVIRDRPGTRGAWVSISGDAGITGFAMATHVVGIAEVEAIVTHPDRRRQGIGAALLRSVIAWSRDLHASRLVLEARSSNQAAIRLYRRAGFAQDGWRRGYYRNPEEDALLMGLTLE